MRLKNTAFIYNVTVNGSSNCDWGTDIGQGAKHTFTLEGFPEVLNAMVYYKIEDTENIKVILGKGNRTPKPFAAYTDHLVLASRFTKIFVNQKHLYNQEFIMYILKDVNPRTTTGKINVHQNRCTLKFSNSLLYKDEPVNQNCIEAISSAFGQSTNGSWAIMEMKIENEDELHLFGFPLGDNPTDYNSKEERNEDFESRFDDISPLPSNDDTESDFGETEFDSQEYKYITAIKTKPFVIIGGFSGTGKSQLVKELAFSSCPRDGFLNISETSPGNYLLVSVKPNWHDSTDIIGFRSSINRSYYVTDFMRFLVTAKQYEKKNIPFFVCLDEMNLAPVEEYFSDFLSVIESRKKDSNGRIVTDALIPASVFTDSDYAEDFNIFLKLGLKPKDTSWTASDINKLSKEDESEAFIEKDIIDDLKSRGLTIPQNVIIIGTVNMDDTTNTFSRKVIDRAMTFETIVTTFDDSYFKYDCALGYPESPRKGELFISDEVRATEMILSKSFSLTKEEKNDILAFINDINSDLEGTPFKISYRILNETILLYRSKKEVQRIVEEDGGFEDDVTFSSDLNTTFDDILMQKVLPRIEGDYDKCNKCLTKLSIRAEERRWEQSLNKIEFMIERFGKDKSGFTSFWN